MYTSKVSATKKLTYYLKLLGATYQIYNNQYNFDYSSILLLEREHYL